MRISAIWNSRLQYLQLKLKRYRLFVLYSFAERRDYCLHEIFNATCRAGSVLLMTSAVYGRMRIGRCIDGDFNIGCATDVLRYFDGQCTARQSCEVDVRNLVDLHPCQRDFMSYLEASYRCVQGTAVTSDLVTDADDKLFNHILYSKYHVVHAILPGRSDSNYNLRPRRHNLVLTAKSFSVTDRDFITRMIYKDTY